MKQDYAFINQYSKEDVYNVYCAAVMGGKHYDRITRKQMLIEIYAEIAYNPEWLEGYMSKDLLTLLLDIQKHGIDMKNINQEKIFMLHELEGLYVIYFDKQTRKYVIPEKLQEALNLYVPSNLHETLDNFYRFMHGLLMTRGFMSKKEAEKIYLKLKPDGMTSDFMMLLNLSSRTKIEVDPFAYEIDNELILLNCMQRYANEHYQPVYAYTWSMYQSISQYGVNLELECMQKLYNLLVKKSTPHHFKNLLEMLVESLQSGKTYLDDLFIHKIYEATNDFEYSKKLFNEVIYALPNWAFKGDPLMMVDDHVTDEMSFEGDFDLDDEDTYDLCPCGSGQTADLCCLDESSNVESFVNLSIDDAEKFYRVLQELMYLYDKSKLPKTYQTVLRYIERLDQTAYIDLKDRVIGNLDIIQSYLDIKGYGLDQVALDLLNGFKHPIKGHYVALGYQDKRLLLYDEALNRQYLVSGIVSPISFNIPNDHLPTIVETTLIPLKDCIIYDVFIIQTPVQIGKNMTNMIKNRLKGKKLIKTINDML